MKLINKEVKVKKDTIGRLMVINTILLGLLMLVPGLTKLFGSGVSGVATFLSGNWLLSWAPMFWAVVLIIAEIGSGLAILTRWKLDKIAYIPVIILSVAAITTVINWSAIGQTGWSNLIFHLVAITNYLLLAGMKR